MNIVIFGAQGQLGQELVKALSRHHTVHAFSREEVDITNEEAIKTALQKHSPSVIINAAAYTAVDKAEQEKALADRINHKAPHLLAAAAKNIEALLIHYSTDYVFDGSSQTPYTENSSTKPLSIYGTTKRAGEEAIERLNPLYFIFRTSWVYGLYGQNFPKTMLRLAKERSTLNIVADQHGTPTSTQFLAVATAHALKVFETTPIEKRHTLSGLYHLTPKGQTTWYELARSVINAGIEHGLTLSCTPQRVHPIPTTEYPTPAKRPLYSVLDCQKFDTTFNFKRPQWQKEIATFLKDFCGTLAK